MSEFDYASYETVGDIVQRAVKRIHAIEESVYRAELIRMGWTPPPDCPCGRPNCPENSHLFWPRDE